VLRQGDPPEDLFILLDGTLVVDHSGGGIARRINELVAPDYVGEIGLVHQTPRTATVVAASDVVLGRLPGKLFLEAVSAQSSVLASGIASRPARTPRVAAWAEQ
jgi:CRP-like cAMP-binding protein